MDNIEIDMGKPKNFIKTIKIFALAFIVNFII